MTMQHAAPRVGSGAAGAESWDHYLDPGERLLWQGQPGTGLRLRAKHLAFILAGCLALGYGLFWMWSLASAAGDAGLGDYAGFGLPFVVSAGLPFMLLGAVFVAAPALWDAYQRRHTRYALTDRRAIIARSAVRRSLESYPIVQETVIDYRPGGTATIYFAEEQRRTTKGRRYTVRHGFELIADGDAVYRLIRGIQGGAGAGESRGA